MTANSNGSDTYLVTTDSWSTPPKGQWQTLSLGGYYVLKFSRSGSAGYGTWLASPGPSQAGTIYGGVADDLAVDAAGALFGVGDGAGGFVGGGALQCIPDTTAKTSQSKTVPGWAFQYSHFGGTTGRDLTYHGLAIDSQGHLYIAGGYQHNQSFFDAMAQYQWNYTDPFPSDEHGGYDAILMRIDNLAAAPAPVVPGIDLDCGAAQPSQVFPGNSVTIPLTVTNTSSAVTQVRVSLRLYDGSFVPDLQHLNAEPIPAPTPVYDSELAGQDQTVTVAPGATVTCNFNWFVPADAAAGTYHVLGRAFTTDPTTPQLIDTTGPDVSTADFTNLAYRAAFSVPDDDYPDYPSQAKNYTGTATLTGHIGATKMLAGIKVGDADCMKFNLSKGWRYAFEVVPVGDFDPNLFLYDAQGNVLAHSDDAPALESVADSPRASRITVVPEADAVYCIGVHGLEMPDLDYFMQGDYTVHVISEQWDTPRDDHPEAATDDGIPPADATSIALHGHEFGHLESANDIDWFKLDCSATDKPYTLFLQRTGTLPCKLSLVDGNGTILSEHQLNGTDTTFSMPIYPPHDAVLFAKVEGLGPGEDYPNIAYRLDLYDNSGQPKDGKAVTEGGFIDSLKQIMGDFLGTNTQSRKPILLIDVTVGPELKRRRNKAQPGERRAGDWH